MSLVSGLSIKYKVILVSLLFVFVFVLFFAANLYQTQSLVSKTILPAYEQEAMETHKSTLKNIIELEASLLADTVKNARSEQEIIQLISDQTDMLRFFDDHSGYFFTYDLNGVRINVPINKSSNGKNLIDLKDKQGNAFVAEFVKAAKNGGGFVTYYFEKEGKGIQPKLSYIKLVPGTDILVGTGVYIDNVKEDLQAFRNTINNELHRNQKANGLIVLALLIVLGVILFFFTTSIIRPLKRTVDVADSLAKGDLSARLNMKRKDEIGTLGTAMDAVAETLSRLNTSIAEVGELASAGFLRKTISNKDFEGDYRALIDRINQWGGAMLQVIDDIPAPVMIRDVERNMRFINKAGSLDLVNVHDLQGRKCSEHFNTGDCHNGQCACDRAFNSGSKEQSTTQARPSNGMELEISYTGQPLGKDAVCEVITDQTAVMRTQRAILDIAGKADGVSNHVAAAAEEISAQVEQSSRGAEEQANRVSETATAMEEMNATVLEVAKNAGQAASTAEQAKSKAEEGAAYIRQLVEFIGKVLDTSKTSLEDMGVLGEQAEGIGNIMNVISDIADQTNLLALNAAIEAARAGDAGRGFAVVADEVRKLAEKTMTATKEVGEAIEGIQAGTRKNYAQVEQAVDAVEEATRLANTSEDSLLQIVQLVDDTADQVRSIATASEQQSAASEEINRSIEQISSISSETSQAMSQAEQAVTELAGQAGVLKGLIDEMKQDQTSAGSDPDTAKG
jgi:methyl-accepting chemotaxis protein